MKACCDDGYATQILANFACKDGGFCHFESFTKSNLTCRIELFFIVILRECEISTEFKKYFNLWILRLKPQYDKVYQYDKQTLVILSEVRSAKRKIHAFKVQICI